MLASAIASLMLVTFFQIIVKQMKNDVKRFLSKVNSHLSHSLYRVHTYYTIHHESLSITW